MSPFLAHSRGQAPRARFLVYLLALNSGRVFRFSWCILHRLVYSPCSQLLRRPRVNEASDPPVPARHKSFGSNEFTISARWSFAAKSIVLAGLMTIFASASFAQGPVSYLTIPAIVPSTGTSVTNTTPLATTLPGYGPVQVSWSPATNYSNQTEPFSPSGAAGSYTWGTSANDLNIFAKSGNLT
jgi:hypothetical protein